MFFRNEYAFLSNFYPTKIEYDGLIYRNAEAAFQAQKEVDISLREKYQYMTPVEAKRAGRKASLRKDWDQVKDNVMYEVVKAKFVQNRNLIKLLVDVETPIIEENYWGDRYWGVCNGKGLNKLGYILSKIRKEFILEIN